MNDICTCPQCTDTTYECPQCGGSGLVQDDTPGSTEEEYSCPECDGYGLLDTEEERQAREDEYADYRLQRYKDEGF